MAIPFNLYIDLKIGKITLDEIEAHAGDSKSVQLNCTFKNGKDVFDLTNYTAKIFLEKKDGFSVFQDLTIDSNPITGKASVILSTQALASIGNVTAYIELYGADETKITTRGFSYTVREGADENAIVSEDDFSALTQALSEVTDFVNTKTELQNARQGKTSLLENLQDKDLQISNIANLIGFNFEQQGGIPDDDLPATATANRILLQSLMNTCHTMGSGTVSFTGKTFYFNKANEQYVVSIYSNVDIVGVGRDKSIVKCISENSTTGGYAFFYNLSGGIDNVHYHDFTVDMYSETMSGNYSSGGKAIYAVPVTNSVFRDLKLMGTPSTALGIDGLDGVIIDNVNCYECGRLWGTLKDPLFDPTLPLSANPYPGGAGIGIGTGILPNENFKIINCTCELCGHYGIFIEHQKIYGGGNVEALDATIANNICRNNRFSGIGVRGGTRPLIIGNQSYGNGCFGLAIDSDGNTDPLTTLKDGLVVGNNFSNNGVDGIHVDGYCNIDGLDIKSNKCLHNGHYGIALGEFNATTLTNTLQKKIVVDGNTLYGNGLGNIYQDPDRLIPYLNLVIGTNTTISADDTVPTVSIIDDTNVNIQRVGTWQTTSQAGTYNGSCQFTLVTGDFARFMFNGTGFKYFSPTKNNKGIANVVVDGGAPVAIDLYTADTEGTHQVYEAQGLTAGDHEVVITCSGNKNASSSGTNISIDAFIITNGDLIVPTPLPVIIQETNVGLAYTGTFTAANNVSYNGGTIKYTTTPGDFVQFSFTGTKIDFISATGTNKGIAQIFLDGVAQPDVDLYAASNSFAQTVYTANSLAAGTHTLKIQCSASKNAASTDKVIAIDAFKIYGGNIV